ncbi:flagellar protein FlaG [Sporosarcina pasteurii]|uniref:Flagellar protein FlaG n=1 Tax=Sporosarcina pasteurii TaxID=1474 RepID=A0A380BE25_SPOPA|nr:flagellar protein FlaG [Sporosarcina pasteurii]MDS9470333.1 flagellar protein FlaG [Sporosarcina pasteurii]QBQ05954.1 flagellar protein FlaG [Sporosarcina pasteurii]SUI99829.1 flagellar protein FlaG [Sporosarcina pasteurii]
MLVNRIEGTQSAIQIENLMKEQSEKIDINDSKTNNVGLSITNAKTMTESINQFLTSTDSHLKFELHEELNEYYVKIVNTKTDEVIREIPSKKLMDVHAALKEFVGLLVDQKI